MKKHFIVALVAFGLSGITLAAEITGTWVSTEQTAALTPGAMIFGKNGTAVLAPEGFDPLKGTYTVDKNFIDINMAEKGKALLGYSIKGKTMTVQYENGSVQHFNKQDSKPVKKAKK